MSYGGVPHDPYAASHASMDSSGTPPPGSFPSRIEYMRAYAYIFDHPQWLATIGWLGILGLINLIPLLNLLYALLLFGYGFTVLDSLLSSGGTQYPAFDFNRLQDYLTRGLWPFLVYLIGSVVLGVVFYAVMFGLTLFGVVAAVVLGEKVAGGIVGLLTLLAILGLLPLVLVGSLALWVMALRSGLARDFASGFDYRWVVDFLRRMWLELLLAGLFLVVSALILEILGLLALCVGILFVGPIFTLAAVHLTYQLYGVYLSRGGTPVPVLGR